MVINNYFRDVGTISMLKMAKKSLVLGICSILALSIPAQASTYTVKRELSGSCVRHDSPVRSQGCLFPRTVSSYKSLESIVWTGGEGADVIFTDKTNQVWKNSECTIGEEENGFDQECRNPFGDTPVSIQIIPHHNGETTYFKLTPN